MSALARAGATLIRRAPGGGPVGACLYNNADSSQRNRHKVLGDGYARAKPQVVSAVMISASLDWAAMTIAAALVAEEEAAPHNGSGIVRATTVMRPLSGRLLVGVTFDPSRGYARR